MSIPEHESKLEHLPVFDDHHGRPEVWSGLKIEGLVHNPTVITEADLAHLTQVSLTDDFRCVEGWSVPDQDWDGVPLSALLDMVGPLPNARFAAISADDYSVTVPLDDGAASILLATRLNGSPLSSDHGGPCRLVMVQQACYSSVKWVDTIRLTEDMPVETAQDIAAARNASRGAATTP